MLILTYEALFKYYIKYYKLSNDELNFIFHKNINNLYYFDCTTESYKING